MGPKMMGERIWAIAMTGSRQTDMSAVARSFVRFFNPLLVGLTDFQRRQTL